MNQIHNVKFCFGGDCQASGTGGIYVIEKEYTFSGTALDIQLDFVLPLTGYGTGKAKVKEREKIQEKIALENSLASEKERQEELEEETAYRQTKSYWLELARKLGLVMPDEVLLREESDTSESEN